MELIPNIHGVKYDPAREVSGVVINPFTGERVFVPSRNYARYASRGTREQDLRLEVLAQAVNYYPGPERLQAARAQTLSIVG